MDTRTARARILDAALDLFGSRGPTGVSMRDIGHQAGVSPALVVHHFGSKDELRTEVDATVVAALTEAMEQLDADASESSAARFFRALARQRPVLTYLARAMFENDTFSASLVETMVAATRDKLDEGEREGWVVPSEDPQLRAVLVTFYDLGMLMLRDHVTRVLGTDLLTEEGGERWMRGAMELYKEGLFR